MYIMYEKETRRDAIPWMEETKDVQANKQINKIKHAHTGEGRNPEKDCQNTTCVILAFLAVF